MYIFEIDFDTEKMPYGKQINTCYNVIASDFSKAIRTIQGKEENAPFDLQQYVIGVKRKDFYGLIGE